MASKKTLTRHTADELKTQVKGKTFLIVGGTRGIGASLAQVLIANEAAKVTVVGRNRTKETPEKATFIQSDVGTVAASRELVLNQLANQKFDTVVFTVGIFSGPKLERTSEGIEKDLAVSYLSRFVIANELIRAQALEGRKRIYIMGYPGQNLTPTDINDINFEKAKYVQFGAHFNTVVYNESLVYELANRHPDVHVFGLNPGLIRTGIRDNVHGGEGTFMGKMLETIISWTNPSVDKYVTRALLPLIATPELAERTSQSFSNKGKLLTMPKWQQKKENREKVWAESQKLVSKVAGDAAVYA